MATMDMDEQLFRLQHGWSLPLKSDQGIRVMPGPKEASQTLCLTDVFLVDPESATGHGVLAVCVEIGAQSRVLAELSSEKPHEVLQTPVVLDEEFCIYMMRVGNADADAVVVEFQGYARPSPNTKEEDHDEDDGDRIDEEDGEGHEEDGDDATGSDYEEDEDEGRSFGGPAPPGFGFGAEHSGQVPAPEASILRIFAFVYLLVGLFAYVYFLGG